MAHMVFSGALAAIARGGVDLLADQLMLSLHSRLWTPDQSLTAWNPAAMMEVSSVGYPPGGKALSGRALAQQPDGSVWLTASNVIFSGVGEVTAGWAVLRDASLPDQTPLCVYDFGGPSTALRGNFVVEFPDGRALCVYGSTMP